MMIRVPDIRSLPYYPLLSGGIFFIALSCASFIGIYFFTAPAVLSPVAGVALAGLLLLGMRFWPAVFLAIYLTYVVLGIPIVFGIFFALGHTVQAVAGVFLLQWFEFDHRFNRLRDALSFISVSFIVATIAPTFGFLGLTLLTLLETNAAIDPATTFTWGHWWTGMILSVLVVTSLIVRWFRKPHVRSTGEVLELVVSFAALLTLSILLFWEGMPRVFNISLIYFLLFPLGWIALRVGPRFMTLGLFALSLIATSGTFFTFTGTTSLALGARLFQTEIFLIIISIIFLILVAVEEERKDTNIKISKNNEELKKAMERLNEHDRAKNNFLAVLAHELRNPLATIVSNFELLKLQQDFTKDGLEAADVIERRFENIQRLLDDLLDVSRISENKIVLQKRLVDLRDAITVAVENVTHLARERSQTVAVDLPELPLAMKGDRTRLEQIFTNLLYNASKFTPEGGRITVTAVRKDNSAVISVKDTGIGIGPTELDKIFEVFYQEKTESAVAKTGLGIGLALTRDLVTMHRGTIHAESAGKDMGSEFIVTLPLTRAPHATDATALAHPEPTTLTIPNMHILIVDDNKAVAEGMAKLLTLSGYSVSKAHTGRDAIRFATSAPAPDAILLDIALPDMSGYEIAEVLRKTHGYEGIIVAVSGYGQEEDKQRAYDAGCTHHLTKPVRLAELLAVLK